MAVTWPHPTYTDGVLIEAAHLNIIRDNMNDLHQSGTWTPTYLGLSTAGVTTYTTQQGNYRKIGTSGLVVAQFEVTWTAASGTGAAIISLPFTALATMEFAMPIYTSNVTYAGGPPFGLVNTATAYMLLGTPTSNAATATIAVEAAGTIFGTAIYFAT